MIQNVLSAPVFFGSLQGDASLCFLPVTDINTSTSFHGLMKTFSVFKTVGERPSHDGLSHQLILVKIFPLFLGEDDRIHPTA